MRLHNSFNQIAWTLFQWSCRPYSSSPASDRVSAHSRTCKRLLPTRQRRLLPRGEKRRGTRERKIAKKPVSSIVLVARQPYFGWFDNRIWW